MKKLIVLLAVVILIVSIASDLPPALPSSFYGTVANGRAGQIINVWVGSVKIATTKVFLWQGQAVYALNVPMIVAEGTIATFKSGGHVWGKAPLRSGTNVNLDLKR